MDKMVQNYSPFLPFTQDWNTCTLDQFQPQHSDLKFTSLSNLNQSEFTDHDQSSRMLDIFNTYTTLNKFDLPDSNNYPSYNNSTDGSNGCTPITTKLADNCQFNWQGAKEFSPSNGRTKVYYTDSNNAFIKHSEKFYTRSESYPSQYKNNGIYASRENESKIGNYSSNRPQQNTNHHMYQNITNKTRKNNPQYVQQPFCDNFNKPDLSSADKFDLPVTSLWDSKKPMYLKILTTQVVSGTIIGKGGKGLNWFRRKSRIDDIHISMPWEAYPGTEYRTILLRGTIKSVVKAVAMTSDLMTHKSDSEFAQGTCIYALIVFPDILLPKIMELKSAYSSKYVSLVPYKVPDFNEIVVSVRGDRQFLRNILSYFVHLVNQVMGITNYCFISYKTDKQNNIQEKNINNYNTLQNNRISFLTGQQYDIPNLSSSDKSETSNLNLTLNDLAPEDLASSGATDGHLRAIDIATSKFTAPNMAFNDFTPEDLKNSNIFCSTNSGDGNDLFNTTCCLSSSPLLDQGLSYSNEVSNYPVTLSFSLPANIDLTSMLINFPQFHNLELPKDDNGLPICSFTGTFNDVFAKASAFISDMHDHTL